MTHFGLSCTKVNKSFDVLVIVSKEQDYNINTCTVEIKDGIYYF